jgi:membrane fusion protein, multidrug efflux system
MATELPWDKVRSWAGPVYASRRRRRVMAGAGVLALTLTVWFLFRPQATPPQIPQAVPVTVATARLTDVPVSITELGAAQAWTSVAVLAQVSGKLLTVDFTEGSDVKAGQTLAQIDPAPYAAALMQAEGALKRDQASLAEARLDLARYQALLTQNAISKQQVDTQSALVRQDEGAVLIDKGAVAAAQVNLDWCRITSPIDGRVGVRLVDPGNLVSASGSVSNTPATAAPTNASSPAATATNGSTSGSSIVIVNQIKPIAVTFTVPEGDFQRLAAVSDRFRKPMTTRAFSQETGKLLGQGELSIADNRVDPNTGTVEMKAQFPNADESLWPGEFVNVSLTLQTLHNATTIPITAVNRGPGGTFAFVVGKDKKVSVRPVTVAWTEGSTAVIGAGIRPGEIVVTDGQMILKAGSLIREISSERAPA